MSNVMISERRIAFRKNVNMVGLICGSDWEMPFASRNLSVGGMAIRVSEMQPLAENTVVNLRLPSLNLEAAAWVTWMAPASTDVAEMGMKFLRFGPIPDGRLPVVPRPYEGYEVIELAMR